jgi:hypothetical protein
MNKISQNKSYILSKDQNLYTKVSNLLPLLKNNNQQPQQQLNNNNLSPAPGIIEQKLPAPQQPNNIQPNNIPNQAFPLSYQQPQNNVYNNNPQNIYQNIQQPNNNYVIQPTIYNNAGNNIYNKQPNTIYNQGGNNNPYVPNNMYKKY